MVKKFKDVGKGDKVYGILFNGSKELSVKELDVHEKRYKRIVFTPKFTSIEESKYGFEIDKKLVFPSNLNNSVYMFETGAVFTEKDAAEKFLKKVCEPNSCLYSLKDGATVYVYSYSDSEMHRLISASTITKKNKDITLMDDNGVIYETGYESASSMFSLGSTCIHIYYNRNSKLHGKMVIFFSKDAADKYTAKRAKNKGKKTIEEYINKQTNKKIGVVDCLGQELHYNDTVVFATGSGRHYNTHSELKIGTIIGENKIGAIVEYKVGKVNNTDATLKKNVKSYALLKYEPIKTVKDKETEI